jgi:REP element-mobilizing transposase RayT
MELGKMYFYTSTIVEWKLLLKPVKYKEIIINSLKHLVNQKKIAVYGFVIMPNHIHLIWELLNMNGKELPHSSFMKFTSHKILYDLKFDNPEFLNQFKSDLNTRDYQFWQGDSLAIELYTPDVIFQKLNYIHNNPVQGKWMLANSPTEYPYSSAAYYATGYDNFGFLTHIGVRL